MAQAPLTLSECSQLASVDEPDAQAAVPINRVAFDFGKSTSQASARDPSRRDVLRVLGAGLLVAVAGDTLFGQTRPNRGPGGGRGGRGGGGAKTVASRVHIG